MGNFSNAALWNSLRAQYPDFKSLTSEGTADLFTEKGFDALAVSNIAALNKFFELSMRVIFQKIDIAKVKTRLKECGLIENFSEANGGYLQRMSMEAIMPVSPGFSDLVDGGSVDPFIVRKPDAKERFFGFNFDYQSFITIQEFQAKTMFINDNGVSAFFAGIMAGLEMGYAMQTEQNIYKCLHELINATELKDSQVLTMATWTDAGVTDAELKDFIANLQDLATAMDVAMVQPGFNMNGFKTSYDPSQFKVLVRAGIKNKIKRQLMVGAYNPEELTIPFEMLEVADFGGIEHYVDLTNPIDGTVKTIVYPHYNTVGTVDGWSFVEAGETGYRLDYALDSDDVYTDDLDSDVLAVVAQKGIIFTTTKNAYSVQPILNPRGQYTNYWANAKNNGVNYDKNYGLIIVKKPTATP